MKSPFLCPARITQRFGVNPQVYGKFGLKGHEGIDLVPDGFDWGVHALEGGTVILDDDDGGRRGAAYGVSVRVQSPDGRVCLYAHLSENVVKLGDVVKEGDLIGIQGNTGHSFGAHLHLSVYKVAKDGSRLNAGNGFKGMVDPEVEFPS